MDPPTRRGLAGQVQPSASELARSSRSGQPWQGQRRQGLTRAGRERAALAAPEQGGPLKLYMLGRGSGRSPDINVGLV
jgi:hypothetical protein